MKRWFLYKRRPRGLGSDKGQWKKAWRWSADDSGALLLHAGGGHDNAESFALIKINKLIKSKPHWNFKAHNYKQPALGSQGGGGAAACSCDSEVALGSLFHLNYILLLLKLQKFPKMWVHLGSFRNSKSGLKWWSIWIEQCEGWAGD